MLAGRLRSRRYRVVWRSKWIGYYFLQCAVGADKYISVSSVRTLEEAKVTKDCLYMQMPVQDVSFTKSLSTTLLTSHSMEHFNGGSTRRYSRSDIERRRKCSSRPEKRERFLRWTRAMRHSKGRGREGVQGAIRFDGSVNCISPIISYSYTVLQAQVEEDPAKCCRSFDRRP
jgi:hypothetical protein